MDKASIKNSVIISLLLVKSILSFGQNYDPEKVSIATLTQKIGDISVDIAQYKPIDYIKSKFYCYAEIRIYKNKIMIDSLVFDDIEPVGGHYGLLVYPSLIMNHLIISKYGDYDGRTIIINDQGQIFSTIGGSVSIDYQSGFLFSSYDSDYAGLSVFDLNKDVELFKIVDINCRPLEFYKANGNRYFFHGNDYETNDLSIWEIELNMERIVQVDLTPDQVKNNKLERLANYEKVQINCQ